MSLNVSHPAALEWVNARRQNIRPWGTFVNTTKFKPPATFTQVSQRIIKNVDYFQSNYIFVFLGLVIYCLLTSPLLLIAVAALGGACYIIKIKNEDKKVSVMGYELTLIQQYSLACLCAFPLFYLAGAGAAVFWIIGASFVLILLHAIFFSSDEVQSDPFTLQMETV